MPTTAVEKEDILPDHRMRLIEALLLWEGEVSNERLRAMLGISSVHASRLIGVYQQRFPRQIERAKGEGRGRYRARPGLAATLNANDPQSYLTLVGDQQSEHIERVRSDYSSTDPEVFGALHRACRNGKGVEVVYHSLSRPEGVRRTLYPHALVQLGTRWHARAWDSDRGAFRDFNLGRISEHQVVDHAAPVPVDQDESWNTAVTLRVRAHSALALAQAKVVEREFFGGAAGRKIATRGCLVHYLIQGMRASTHSGEAPPEFLLEVSNVQQVRKWLMPGKPGGQRPE